jgi:hypothetical protein
MSWWFNNHVKISRIKSVLSLAFLLSKDFWFGVILPHSTTKMFLLPLSVLNLFRTPPTWDWSILKRENWPFICFWQPPVYAWTYPNGRTGLIAEQTKSSKSFSWSICLSWICPSLFLNFMTLGIHPMRPRETAS